MPSVNELLLHAAVDHSIDLTHYGNGVLRRIIALLNRTDADLFRHLTAAMERMPSDSFTVQRLDALLADVRTINGAAYKAVQQGLEADLKDLVDYEAGYQLQLFQSTLPVQVEVAAVATDAVYSAAMSRPFQGRILAEWAQSIEADRMVRIRDAVRIGFVEGETIDQMVSRIRGTKARGYDDGLIAIDRRNCESVVRTAVNHTANFTGQRFYDANISIIKGLVWVSTLDGRTSAVCRARDGEVFPLNSGPRPPAHWNCRSRMGPVTRSWRELGINMDEVPLGSRASMDGQVPAGTTYQKWLEGQSAARQDEILGPSRGKLFRAGETVDRFVNRQGRELTLDAMRARDAELFKRAGL